jgi:hypothetical protein
VAQVISEKFSENQKPPKRRRGRPRLQVLDPDYRAVCEAVGLFPSDESRTKQNRMYAQRAIHILGQTDRPQFKWLFDLEAIMANRPHSMRKTILSELGRIKDDGELIQAAFDICHLKPKTKTAISIIRQVRIGRPCPGDVYQLTKLIADTILDYRQRHPGTTFRDVYYAIIPVVQAAADNAALDSPELDELIEELCSRK